MGLGSIVSGALNNTGSKKAYEAQLQSQLAAMQEMQNAYNDIDKSYQPYVSLTKGFLDDYANTIRGNTDTFENSPWGKAYNDYVLNNTINKIQGSAAAGGNLLSGNTLKELQTNIQSINSNDYLNRLNNYLGYAGGLGNQSIGLTKDLGNYRWNQATGNANAWNTIGEAKASQQINKYNNLGQMWGGSFDTLTNGLKGFNAYGISQGGQGLAALGGLGELAMAFI